MQWHHWSNQPWIDLDSFIALVDLIGCKSLVRRSSLVNFIGLVGLIGLINLVDQVDLILILIGIE